MMFLTEMMFQTEMTTVLNDDRYDVCFYETQIIPNVLYKIVMTMLDSDKNIGY